jgi:hypothetical protein
MRRDDVPQYKFIPEPPKKIEAGEEFGGDFYSVLGELIRAENPYGGNIISRDITPPFDNTEPNRKSKLDALEAVGVRIMGWLRDRWSLNPVLSCNHRMTIADKQKSYYWTTMYPEVSTTEFPNYPDDDAEHGPKFFETPPDGVLQNSGDVELHQVCKAIHVPFEYVAEDGRHLQAAILIGYVGSGGGQ